MGLNRKPLLPCQYGTNRLIWWMIAGMAIIDAAWILAAGLTIDTANTGTFIGIFFLFLFISFFYRRVRRDEHLWLLGQTGAQILVTTGVGAVLSYVTVRTALPLIDENLIAIDRWFGFDWLAHLKTVDAYPWLATLLTLAYQATGPQIIIIAVILFLCGETMATQRFTVTFIVAAAITIVLAALFPAVGGYLHYNLDLTQYPNLNPAASRLHEAPLMGMRNHTMEVLSFPLRGIVTFPSFHTTLALVLIFACRPVKWLFAVILPVNLLTIVSTPVDGGHYLSDVFGGIAVALIAMQIGNRLTRQKPA